EALSINSVLDFAQFAHDKCQFYNWYGPAECTEAASKYLISGNELKQGHLPIGRPIPNVHIYIVDDYLQHVIPDIQIGDIVIGGSGVFAGYTDDLLTHQALIDIDGKLCYRTGDLGRLNIESGQIEFKGRRDYQVKLRGQRIELTEVENTILEATDWVQNCVVVIQIDEESVSSLVAHIMVKSEDDRLRGNVIDYCRQRLPFYMVPSMWSFVDRLPINDNGKIDRKRLPRVSRNRHQDEVITPGTELEEQLQLIFSQVFHIPLDDVDVTLSFELLGGTSLGIIHALSMIRNQIYEGVDVNLLLTYSSIRKLAVKLESLRLCENASNRPVEGSKITLSHPKPCLAIETVGIFVLGVVLLLPFYIGYKWLANQYLFLWIPMCNMLTYIVFRWLLSPSNARKNEKLFSVAYYRWWFLNRMWTWNRSLWLRCLVDTDFYNFYLRMCGARIGYNVHILTTQIDAPWLVSIDDNAFIADEVYLNNISYHSHTFNLHSISVGASCKIDARTVLQKDVQIQHGACIESYSVVTGLVAGTNQDNLILASQLFKVFRTIFQFAWIFVMIAWHTLLLNIVTAIYFSNFPRCLTFSICWLLWIFSSAMVGLFLLKYIVGKGLKPGTYKINSWSYLRHIWLRQFIVTTVRYSLSVLFDDYQSVCISILRWLGVQIHGTNIKLAEIVPFLRFPTHLLCLGNEFTSFGDVQLVPFNLDTNYTFTINRIRFGRKVTLGNYCSIHPGVYLGFNVLVATLTCVKQETFDVNNKSEIILLGIPARQMPFVQQTVQVKDTTTDMNRFLFDSLRRTLAAKMVLVFICNFCFQFISNELYICLLILPFLLISAILFSFLSYICEQLKHCVFSLGKKITDQFHEIVFSVAIDSYHIIDPLVGGTQWLVYICRSLGAQIIGDDIILSESSNITDHSLIIIGEHVRMSAGATIQAHTFEQRVFQLAPVTVGPGSIIEANSFVFPGAILEGENMIEPLTLIMKGDHLDKGTRWFGNPAQCHR
ncbi:unnamed protein product, partial [Rotaria sp. Silwood1]